MSRADVMIVPCPKCAGACLDKRLEASFYDIKEKNRIGKKPPPCPHCQGRGVREYRPNDKRPALYIPQTKADARAEAIEELERTVEFAEAKTAQTARIIKRGRPRRAA
jgi:hypothetical protein